MNADTEYRLRELQSCLSVLKARWDESKHPRKPKGSSGGGQFSSTGAGSDTVLRAMRGYGERNLYQLDPFPNGDVPLILTTKFGDVVVNGDGASFVSKDGAEELLSEQSFDSAQEAREALSDVATALANVKSAKEIDQILQGLKRG